MKTKLILLLFIPLYCKCQFVGQKVKYAKGIIVFPDTSDYKSICKRSFDYYNRSDLLQPFFIKVNFKETRKESKKYLDSIFFSKEKHEIYFLDFNKGIDFQYLFSYKVDSSHSNICENSEVMVSDNYCSDEMLDDLKNKGKPYLGNKFYLNFVEIEYLESMYLHINDFGLINENFKIDFKNNKQVHFKFKKKELRIIYFNTSCISNN